MFTSLFTINHAKDKVLYLVLSAAAVILLPYERIPCSQSPTVQWLHGTCVTPVAVTSLTLHANPQLVQQYYSYKTTDSDIIVSKNNYIIVRAL